MGGTFSFDSSRNNPDHPLGIDPTKISVSFKAVTKQGSLGKIYTGKYSEEMCAVKVFNNGIILKDALQEHEIASIVQKHPNIVLIHGLWYGNTANALPYKQPALVMEMCCISLDVYLKQKVEKSEVAVFRFETRLDILTGIASGMAHLHSNGIVHGNLCAKKVLLDFTGPTLDQKVTAKVAGANEMKFFAPDTVKQIKASLQKSSIMPPEVKKGGVDIELTEPVDLFSFGCLVAHVACCVFPEPNTKAGLNEFQRRAQCITGSRHPDVYEPLMKKCLAEEPTARGTFENVMEDLSVHRSGCSGKQAQKLEEQLEQRSQANTLSGGSPRSTDTDRTFLPCGSVDVSDRTRREIS